MALTKIDGEFTSPDFAGQNIATTGSNTAGSFIPTSSTAPVNGVYLAAANKVGIATNSTGKIFIDSSGKVGIGTSSPNKNLHISQVNAGGDVGLRIQNDTDTDAGTTTSIRFTASSTDTFDTAAISVDRSTRSLAFATIGNEAMRIDSSGNVGIGGSPSVFTGQNFISIHSPGSSTNIAGIDLHVSGTREAGMLSYPSIGESLRIFGNGARSITFHNNSAERMQIDSLGRLLVGNTSTSNTGLLCVKGNASSSTGAGQLTLQKGTAVTGADQELGSYNLGEGSASTAKIRAFTGANWTGSSRPTHLTFETTASGSSGPSERLRIDSSGRLLVGTSSAVTGGTSQFSRIVSLGNSAGSTNPGVISVGMGATPASGNSIGRIFFVDNNAGEYAEIAAQCDGTPGSGDYPGRLVFSTTEDGASSPTERMQIDSSGNVFIGITSLNLASSNGVAFYPGGTSWFSETNDYPLGVNRIGSDGTLINFTKSGTSQGSISVSGSTVSYNGAHLSRWSQLSGGVERTEILRGSVLSNLDEMCEWAYEGQDAVLYAEEDELPEGVSVGDVKTPAVVAGTEDNEQLNRMQVSTVEGDKNVSGVFQAWDDDDDTYVNDFYCAMTGDFVIRIAQGTTVARGDLLISAGDGTAKPQDDDIVRSKTIAKVTSTTISETYSDNSYCVPCVLMAC